MNKDNAKDYLPLVQALAEGKELQFRVSESYPWSSLDHFAMEYKPECYRIKPEPSEIWVTHYYNGQVFIHPDVVSAKVESTRNEGVTRRYREVIECSIHKGSKVRLLDNVYYHDSREERCSPGTEGYVTSVGEDDTTPYYTVRLESYDTPMVFVPSELESIGELNLPAADTGD